MLNEKRSAFGPKPVPDLPNPQKRGYADDGTDNIGKPVVDRRVTAGNERLMVLVQGPQDRRKGHHEKGAQKGKPAPETGRNPKTEGTCQKGIGKKMNNLIRVAEPLADDQIWLRRKEPDSQKNENGRQLEKRMIGKQLIGTHVPEHYISLTPP